MPVSKKRVIKSLDTLSEDLKELIKRQYPNGYDGNITRIASPKKEPLFVFPLETDDATYLVKVPVTKNSDGGYDMENRTKGEFEDEDDFGTGDGISGEESDTGDDNDDFDEGGGGPKASGEASYDPDFDN
jgi:hypothetical protein